jgi:hypothetical protein
MLSLEWQGGTLAVMAGVVLRCLYRSSRVPDERIYQVEGFAVDVAVVRILLRLARPAFLASS